MSWTQFAIWASVYVALMLAMMYTADKLAARKERKRRESGE